MPPCRSRFFENGMTAIIYCQFRRESTEVSFFQTSHWPESVNVPHIRCRGLSRNGHGHHSFPQFENLTGIDSTSRLTACWFPGDTLQSGTGICGNSLAAKSRLPLCFYSSLRIFRACMYRSQTRKNHYLSPDCSDPISRVLTPETFQFHYGHIPIAHHQTIDPSQCKRQ